MARPYTLTTINRFKGLTSAINKAGLEPNEFTNLVNMDVNQGGYLEKRRGIYRFSSVRPQAAGLGLRLMAISRGNGSTVDQMWLTDSSKLYRVNNIATVWNTTQWAGTDLTTAPQWMVERKINGNHYAMAVVRSDNPPFFVKPDGVIDAAAGSGPVGTMCADYKGRMWTINSLGHSGADANIDFSAVEDWMSWSGTNGSGIISINPGDGQFLTSLQVYNDNLYIFKDRSIWVLNGEGDPTGYTPRLVHATIGCVGRGTVQLIDGFMYFLSGEGVYRTDGTTFEELSQPIRNEFWNTDYRSQSTVLEADAIHWNNKYVLSMGTTTTIYVFDTVSEAWTLWKPPVAVPLQLKGMATYQEKGTDKFYAGSSVSTGYLMACGDDHYEDDTSGLLPHGDSSKTYVSYINTGDFVEDVPGEWKRNHYIALDCQGAQNITEIMMNVKKDNLATTAATSTRFITAPSSTRTQIRFKGAGYHRSMSLEMEIKGRSSFSLFGITLANEVKDPVHRGN